MLSSNVSGHARNLNPFEPHHTRTTIHGIEIVMRFLAFAEMYALAEDFPKKEELRLLLSDILFFLSDRSSWDVRCD